jgi:hypothetical protein
VEEGAMSQGMQSPPKGTSPASAWTLAVRLDLTPRTVR